jgi:hypothetical protein
MPSGRYDRTKHEKVCEYCNKTFVLTTKQWNSHNTEHIQKGDQKHSNSTIVLNGSRTTTVNENGKNLASPNIPPASSTAITAPHTCGECLAKGITKTFRNAFGLTIHRSRMHDFRGPNYKYNVTARKQRRGNVSIAHQGDMNGNETFDHQAAQRAADQERLAYYGAGYTTRTIEGLAASLDQPPSLLTARILSILTMGPNPVREELRGKSKVSRVRGEASA